MVDNSKQMKDQVKQMLSGLDGLCKGIESMVEESYKNMGPEHMKQFAQAYKDAKAGDAIDKIKSEIEKLKTLKI